MIQPDLPTVHDLARYSLAAQHPRTLEWSSRPDRLSRLAGEHTIDLDLATDRDIAQQRAATLQAGPPVEAYLNTWHAVTPDLQAMLSIRFTGGDVSRPFVDVSVTSRPVTPADLPALVTAARSYAAFGPPRLRFWSCAALDTFAHLGPDLRVLAAPLADLRDRPAPDDLRLTPTRDSSHHSQAVAAYAAVDVDHPAHRGQAGVISVDDLQEAIDAGTMFDVVWQGQWSGYAGTLAHSQLGLDAQVVQELLLTPPARGHGLGAALSTLLARQVPPTGQVLSGTIHGRNRGARQAALRAGRHDVGGWWWVPLA
ncbi:MULTISPECIES: hypothetical protein [Deinococcus]|uniref:N-acetyltransferase domain-containing protein n=1 Tax=Deinococcus rufus TaxID=2136097 RepID=A0ABV7ZBV0_9DEIO|nr:hypothetical protein [Deinococcus sp. AB2017081]WQE94008.1 hypothetical protein U2P90_11370 [Deinococcus sp. AB2017081]